MMDAIRFIFIFGLIVIGICFIIDWLLLPYKIDKTNKLLEEIKEVLRNEEN